MITVSLKAVLLTTLISIFYTIEVPSGWMKAGDAPEKYEMGVDFEAESEKTHVATIKSVDSKIEGFGTLMQQSLPGELAGHRVKMTGLMKSKDLSHWAALWFRVDNNKIVGDRPLDQTLEFDNMENRPIKGTTDWKKYEIVLDVPIESSKIAFGALIHGTGQVWFKNIQFSFVDKSVTSTSLKSQTPLPGKDVDISKFTPCNSKITNLNFEL